MRSRLTVLIAVIAFAAVTVAAGCGSSNDNGGTSGGGTLTAASFSVQTDPAIAGQVPADVKSNGSLSVAADASGLRELRSDPSTPVKTSASTPPTETTTSG